MESFNKNVTDAATKLSKEATEFAEKYELEKKVEGAKKSAEEFAKEHELDVKAKEAKDKAEGFSKEHELEKKFEEVKGSAETFVKEHELDIKMNEAKRSADGFAKEHNLDVKYEEAKNQVEGTISDVKSGVDAGAAIAEEEKIMKNEEEKSVNIEGSSNNIEEKETTPTQTTEKEDHPGDVTLEALMKEVNAIAHKIEVETIHLTEREDVQKVLTPLMAKLTIAKSKFIAMTQKNKGKGEDEGKDDRNEDESGVEIELGKEDEAEVVVENNDDGSASKAEKEKPRRSKLPSEFAQEEMMYRAKKAVKNALENAEAAVIKTADKFGIHFFDEKNEDATEIKTEDKDDKAVVDSV